MTYDAAGRRVFIDQRTGEQFVEESCWYPTGSRSPKVHAHFTDSIDPQTYQPTVTERLHDGFKAMRGL